MAVKGVPPDYIVDLSSNRNQFFEMDSITPIIFMSSQGYHCTPNMTTLQGALKDCQDLKFIDFIDRCLDWDPANRMTPLEALQHEWILEGLPSRVLARHKKAF